MNQGGKYVDTLLQLASQSNSLLTQKEVEQVDLLIDKCVAVLPECDKATFVRVLASFLRLFLYCPLVSTEVFYRRYYGILKEGFLFKTKNGPQQKYECLILTLLDVAEKNYFPAFSQAIKNTKDLPYNQLIESILTINLKGGLNLKAFTALLRKSIEKDKEYSRIQEAIVISRDIFHKFTAQLEEDLKKSSKILESYLFKFFIIHSLLEQLESRFEPIKIAAFKEMFRQFVSKYEQGGSLKTLIFLQFLSVNQHKIPIMEVIQERKSQSAYENCGKRRRNYIVDILLASQLLKGVNHLANDRNGQYLVETLHLLRSQYKTIASVINQEETSIHNITQSLLQQGCNLLEQASIQLLVNMRLHLASLDLAKTSPLSLMKTMIVITSPFSQQFNLFNGKNSTLDGQFYHILLQCGLGCKTKVCLALLYFSLFSSAVADYHSVIMLQARLFDHLRSIIQQSTFKNDISGDFIEQLYLFMSFKTSKSQYLAKLHGGKPDEANIFKQVLDFYANYNPDSMAEETTIDQFLQANMTKLKSEKYTFQGLLDLITGLMQNEEHTPSFNEQAQDGAQFSELSLILFDKINIKPKAINRIKQQISFTIEKGRKKSKFCLSLFRRLYELDGLMRSNTFFMQSAPEIQQGERLMVVALKKYFSIYCSRINELVIRKWIINRQFLKIWSLLLCNFKVKTIAEQFLKCGISVGELTCFFKVDEVILKEFLEYLITKDKYRFKLALFTCGLTNRKELVDYSLPDVII